MKIYRLEKGGQRASVLVVALCIVALFSFIVGSYITLVMGQATSVSRGQKHDSAIPVAEAGVEEALALLNKNYPSISTAGSWQSTLASDGWSALSASNTTTKSNYLAAGDYYLVTVSNTPSGNPVIFSAGVVPFTEYAWGSLDGSAGGTASTNVALVRTLQVWTTSQALFGAGLAAKGDIVFSGGAAVDSFNSANSNLSLNGQYTPLKKHDKATVGTDGKVVDSITSSGNVSIRGYVNTGPGGTIADNGSVSIGDNNWVSNGTTGIELSRSNDNFNVTFPDVAAPSVSLVQTATGASIGGTNYSYVFYGNNYWGSASNVVYEQSISLTGQNKAIVTNGSVTLYIPYGSSFSTTGQSFIYVAPGSSLSIYCGASSASLSGGSFVGATNAEDLAFYGLPTLTSISYSGGSAYTGTIYAPEADFRGTGGSTFVGALVANTFTFTGSATVHYDENLAAVGPATGFVATNWQEIVTPIAYQELTP